MIVMTQSAESLAVSVIGCYLSTQPIRTTSETLKSNVILRSFHRNRAYHEIFLKLCQLIVYNIGDLNLEIKISPLPPPPPSQLPDFKP